MRRNLLGMFERATVLKISRNPSRAKSMTAGGIGKGGSLGAAFYHVKHVTAYHRIAGQLVAFFEAPEQRPLLIVADAGGSDPSVKIFVQAVMAGHLMPFAAFLMEPEPGAATLLKIVLHPQADDRADASEGVAHQPDQGAVTEADEFSSIDRFQQLAHLGARQHRGLTTCDHELGAAHRAGGGGDQHATRDQVIEQLTDRSQVLLHARLSNFGA